MISLFILFFISFSSAESTLLFKEVIYTSLSKPDLVPIIVICTVIFIIASVIVGSILTNKMAKEAEQDAILYLAPKNY